MSDGKPSTPEVPGDSAPQPAPAGAGGGTRPGEAPSQDTLGNFPPADYQFLDPPQKVGEMGLLGGYRVLRVLGRGGMGVVFEGEDPLLGRRVAIKVPLAGASDETYQQRFLREARIAATLPHDHIAAVFQAGHHKGVPFLAMELLRGESLEDRLEREKSLPVAEALRIAREIAAGLQVAHSRSLVHRDVKPANIWLEGEPAARGEPEALATGASTTGGRVKILDFGIAREVQGQEGITRSGMIVGSVGYLAPEQVLGGPPDPRSDLFALGCVLHRMLFGRLPFTGSNTYAALHAVVNEDPAGGSAVGQLPPAVVALVADLLQKDPAKRTASAGLVVERIQAIERELARPSTSPGRVAERPVSGVGRRLPWGVLFGAAVLLAAVAAGVLALFYKLHQTPPTQAGTPGQAIREQGPGRERPQPPVVTPAGAPIKVGILHSTSGALASTEVPVVEATLLAIDEINQSGGVLGRQIEPILQDGASTEEGFDVGARKLLNQDGVVTIFGCWTASSRRRVGGLCALMDNLLVYPIDSEGLEESPYIFYIGGAPNQILNPAVGWAVGMLKKRRFFLVGSDYVYARVCNAILEDELRELRVEKAGEGYVPLQEVRPAAFTELVRKIQMSGADAILNNIDSDQANIAFFHALAEAGVKGKELPCFSFSFYEVGLNNLPNRAVADHFFVGSYFQSLSNPANQDFLERLKARFPTRLATDPMATAWSGVHLWARAVAQAGSDRPDAIRKALAHQQFEGPEGLVRIDPANNYAIRRTLIGRALNNREIEVVYQSPRPVPPEPFPPPRTRAQWEDFLQKLWLGWGHSWEAPPDKPSR